MQNQLAVFKKHLIHDIDCDVFADIYAQTVAYGMFAARLHDSTSATFTRFDATEHTYRAALQSLLETTLLGIAVINEPNQIECGTPDYVLTRNAILRGYIEAKDLDKDLDDKSHTEQLAATLNRSATSFSPTTSEFSFIRNDEQIATVCIVELRGDRVKSKLDQFATFTDLLDILFGYGGTTIRQC